jgi:putative acetyltransferase
MTTVIVAERPDSVDARQLIAELEAQLDPLYPPASRHGFSVDKLLREAVAFFVMRQEGTAAGCGGVKLFGTAYGEIKRMYVRSQFRGLGLGRLMLNHLAEYALGHGVGVLRLETGIYQAEAMSLYERWGFERIPPFGEYQEDPLSVFYEKRIGLIL